MTSLKILVPDNICHFQRADPSPILTWIVIKNALIALEWEAVLLRTLFGLNNVSSLLRSIVTGQTFPQLNRPEVLINAPGRDWIDVRKADSSKVAERSAGKKPGKKRRSDLSRQKKKRNEGERPSRRQEEEEERERKWRESWDRKLQREEELEEQECCLGGGLCPRPRTQSNIWINVFEERMIQDVQMTFKRVQVPKPKPPPLPRLRRDNTPDNAPTDPGPRNQPKKKRPAKKRK